MGAQISRQIQVVVEEQELQSLEEARGTAFPGSNCKHPNRKEWMATLDLDEVTARDVVWPGTHNSATDRIGVPFLSRPFFQCQKLSIYEQLVRGVRVFDIRVQQDRRVCHGILCTYSVDVVVDDVKRFLHETSLEFLILELRTEWKRFDPVQFDEYLIARLGEYLIPQDERLLDKPLRALLPGRVFCVWKPNLAPSPSPGSPLWTGDHLLDNWVDTDLPFTKFLSNLEYLKKQAPNATRPYFYRVENTATPQNTGLWCVYPVTNRIRGYARLFLAETFRLGLGDRLQIFSEDFVTTDFVDACIGVTMARFPFQLGLLCLAINAVIFAYLAVYLRHILKSEDKWELVAPAAIPTATLVGLTSSLLFSIALWPIWGFLTLPLLFTLFMAFVVISPYLPPYGYSLRSD